MTEKVATRADQGRDAVKASLLEVIGKVVAQASAQGIEPCGLGIASAGAINTEDGTVFAATSNLPNWAGFNLRQVAEERFHLPTYVINDAHAAVLAELHYGLGRSFTDFVQSLSEPVLEAALYATASFCWGSMALLAQWATRRFASMAVPVTADAKDAWKPMCPPLPCCRNMRIWAV